MDSFVLFVLLALLTSCRPQPVPSPPPRDAAMDMGACRAPIGRPLACQGAFNHGLPCAMCPNDNQGCYYAPAAIYCTLGTCSSDTRCHLETVDNADMSKPAP